MKKWEHCTLFVASNGELTVMDSTGSRNVEAPENNPLIAMDVLGSNGWELVAALAIQDSGEPGDFVHNFYFKRHLVETKGNRQVGA